MSLGAGGAGGGSGGDGFIVTFTEGDLGGGDESFDFITKPLGPEH